MRLKDAARYFDRIVCQDAYSAGSTFLAQLDLFDDAKRDGATVARRVLSVADDVTLPARGAVKVHDDYYVVGGSHKDSFNGAVVRNKFVVHKADALATVKTMDQTLRSLTGTSAYAARLWVKDMKEIEVSSKLSAFYNLYFSASETVTLGSVVTIGSALHLVRGVFISAAGFRVCEADELPAGALTTATYTDKSGQAYDSTTDTMGALTPGSVAVLWHRYQAGFERYQASAEPFAEGDITLSVSKTAVATAGAGDTFTMASVSWRVIGVRDDGLGAWILHCRRA